MMTMALKNAPVPVDERSPDNFLKGIIHQNTIFLSITNPLFTRIPERTVCTNILNADRYTKGLK